MSFNLSYSNPTHHSVWQAVTPHGVISFLMVPQVIPGWYALPGTAINVCHSRCVHKCKTCTNHPNRHAQCAHAQELHKSPRTGTHRGMQWMLYTPAPQACKALTSTCLVPRWPL